MHLIQVQDDKGTWASCGEGPFDTLEEAQTFAAAEVGVSHRVISVRRFTPLSDSGNGPRLELALSDDDAAHVQRGPWSAIVTDQITGRAYKAQGAPCCLPNCYCDAIVSAAAYKVQLAANDQLQYIEPINPVPLAINGEPTVYGALLGTTFAAALDRDILRIEASSVVGALVVSLCLRAVALLTLGDDETRESDFAPAIVDAVVTQCNVWYFG